CPPLALHLALHHLAVPLAAEQVEVAVRRALTIAPEALDVLQVQGCGAHGVPRDLARQILRGAVPDLVLVHLAVAAADAAGADHLPAHGRDRIADLRQHLAPGALGRGAYGLVRIELP